MERLIKEIVSSVTEVKVLLKNLNQDTKGYLVNAKVAVNAFDSLLDADKAKIMNDICIKYKYFDAKAFIQRRDDISRSKPALKLLLSLDIGSIDYEKNAKLALKKVSLLSPAQTAILLRNKASQAKLSEAKAYFVSKAFIELDLTSRTYTLEANNALDMYKNLFPEEKVLVDNNEKSYRAYSLAELHSIKCLLMKFDTHREGHAFIGRDALSKFEDLSHGYKNHIMEDLFYRNKINMINMVFDKMASDELIKKLHNLFMASLQSCLTSEYFAHALRLISEFEGATDGAKRLVEAQAAFELQVANDGKNAHPVVFLAESYLPNKNHSKYYEIADILVAAYKFGLTNRQKLYVKKSTYTMELINEAMEEMTIKEEAI